MSKLVIVGTVAFDAIETPFGKTDRILGGAGTYIALASSYFDIKTKIISVVGGDFPDEHIELLKKNNIDTTISLGSCSCGVLQWRHRTSFECVFAKLNQNNTTALDPATPLTSRLVYDSRVL